jgi:hypothetical protein
MHKREELRSKILSPFNSRQRRSGASLPSVLVGVGIMGIVAAGMGQVYKTHQTRHGQKERERFVTD